MPKAEDGGGVVKSMTDGSIINERARWGLDAGEDGGECLAAGDEITPPMTSGCKGGQ